MRRKPLMIVGGILLLTGLGAVLAWRSAASRDPASGHRTTPEAAHSERAEAAVEPKQRETFVPPLPPVGKTQPQSAEQIMAEAIGVLEHLTARFPENPDAHELLARFRLWTGETAAAVEAWRRCLELNPSYGHAHQGLGSVAAKRGDYQQAIAHYRQAIAIEPGAADPRIELAKALIAADKSDEAAALLEETVELFPDATDAFYHLGTIYLQQKEFQNAKERFETVLAQVPQYAAAQIGLARACLQLGLQEEAQRHQERFRQLREQETEQSRQARLQFNDLEITGQEVARIFVGAGQVYVAGGEPTAAELIWSRASALDPNNIASRQALAWLNLQQGEVLETIGILRELAKLEPNNLTYRPEIARLYLRVGRTAAAEEMLQQHRDAAPQDPAGHAALAQLYLQTEQKLPQALQLAEQAVALAPHADHLVLLAGAYERNKQWTKATDAMAQAIQLDPKNDRYRQMLDLLKQRAGQEEQ